MVEISEEFRAAWAQAMLHNNGDVYAPEDEERHLRAAWDQYCGTRTPVPNPMDQPAAFVNDWNSMVATISTFCAMYDMRKPDMIFHPQWLRRIRATAEHPIAGTLIHMGVRIRFGAFEQATVFRGI